MYNRKRLRISLGASWDKEICSTRKVRGSEYSTGSFRQIERTYKRRLTKFTKRMYRVEVDGIGSSGREP